MRMKKFLSIGLVLGMVVSAVGCGKTAVNEQSKTDTSSAVQSEEKMSSVVEEKKDPVTLEWWYRGNGIQADTEKVNDAFNELLQTYPGMEHVTVHFNPFIAKEYGNAVTLAQSASEQIDILGTVSLNFQDQVSKGTYLSLNDMLDEHTALKDELPDWLWDYGKVGDDIYMVPNYQRAASLSCFCTPKEYMDKYGDYEAMKEMFADPDTTMDEIASVLEEYLLAIRKGEGIETKYMPPMYPNNAYGIERNYFDAVYGAFLVKYDGSDKIEFADATESAQKAYEINASWYEKGYIHPEILTVDEKALKNGANLLNEESYIFTIDNGMGDEETINETNSVKFGFETVCIPIRPNYFIGMSWGAGGNGITSSCKNPEEAIQLLELMNTEAGKDLYNMMVYGIEGTHYTKIDEENIKTLHYDGSQSGVDVPYGAMKWILGNTFHAYLNQGCAVDENNLSLEVNNNPNNVISDLIGFALDTTKIQTQLDQIKALTTEYQKILRFGVKGADWKSYYDEFYNKAVTAGLNDVLAEVQSQVDTFLAK